MCSEHRCHLCHEEGNGFGYSIFEETAPILEPIAGTNSRENYTLNFNLGLAYSDLGDYVRAQKRLEEATRIADNILARITKIMPTLLIAWPGIHTI